MPRRWWRELTFLVRTAIRVDPWRSLGTVLEPLGALMYPLFGWFLGVVANGVLEGDTTRLVAGGLGLLVTVALHYVSSFVATGIRVRLAEQVGFALDREIAELTATLPGLEHHERADYQERLELLRQHQGILGQALNSIVSASTALVGALGTGVVLALLHPFVLLLVLFALPAFPIASIQQRWQAAAEAESAAPARLARHLRHLTTDREAAMEMRVFGLQREILSRLDAAWATARRPLHRATAKETLTGTLRSLSFAIGFALAVGFVLWQATRGAASAGEVITAVIVCQRVQNQVLGPAYSIAGLGRVLRAAGRLLWLKDYAREVTARRRGDQPAPERLSDGIRFEGVSFRYPGTGSWALRDVTLHIPAGSVVALVGENGAGKTTLVKLLSRMYEPTEGRILVDGVDLRDIDPLAWRARLSAAFQDFTRFEFLARQTVGVGDLPRLDDVSAVEAALERAGATDVLPALPTGGDTQLGASWPDGVDLSTGQWQKLALGRALMRDRPLVVFFDEPTASLDAPTEHALFERYAEASRSGTEDGRITVLVSHRFSTVRSADLIVVVDDGRVREWGRHDELMARSGLYAELYSLQANSYR
ncbi:ABC transporter ATP-binding protein [Thermasporomyces composti]|jgi:ATP-binding cassette subfamily B protein|uniref:ATP-binding cassette subfamily B protein n=1 Tax=Thermasporomyces composti TaxID=696763 RepID=A0A3D9V927_THECX|nr:ABC transporter ATP-binding protein [Thermasporomyces composti]REF37989.1 ATP-binding cassette subfamily B protein [Thermasporomyces composti]